ncbi:enoyl-CoA hydratase/isomerase family protein [Desulfogranum japonicum]|uniref:enoyl-CoA hydratase/isomerase family protein n=1 Tax=Desulfogranum japonicum TaxID=231447 RepID=UPI00040AFF80|nr:enoyl-CoA hydratase/isomerase family protein [Desulfogranum japonicum]
MLQVKPHDGYIVIQLDNGIPNALGIDVILQLDALLDRVKKEKVPLVLTGNAKFFSMGLHLPEIIGYNPEEFTHFISSFEQLVHSLYTLPVPVVCAMEGHAVAGGAILALACDMRIGADGAKKFGCNEAQLGVPVPFLPSMLVRQIVSDAMANRLLYRGDILSFKDAHGCGLLDDLVTAPEIIATAGKVVCQMVPENMQAFSVMKAIRTACISEQFHKHNKEFTHNFVQCWFQKASQELIRKAAQKF